MRLPLAILDSAPLADFKNFMAVKTQKIFGSNYLNNSNFKTRNNLKQLFRFTSGGESKPPRTPPKFGYKAHAQGRPLYRRLIRWRARAKAVFAGRGPLALAARRCVSCALLRFCRFFLLGGVRRGSSLLWASWASRVLGCLFLLPLAFFCGVGAFLLFFASRGCSLLVAFSGGSALVAFFFCPPAFRSCAFRGSSLRLALARAFSLRCGCVLARSLCFCLAPSLCFGASVAWFFLFLRCSLVIRRVAAFFFCAIRD